MIKYGKNVLIGVLVLALTGALIYQFFNKPIKTENNVAKLITLDKKPSVEYTDKTGKQHTTKEIIYITDKQAALLYRKQIDSLTELLGIKDAQIVGLTSFSGKADISFKPDITYLEDSLKKVVYAKINYESKWFSLSGNTNGQEPFKASFRDSINIAFVKKPYGFLKLKDKIYADAFSANPDMKYTNIKSWAVPEARNNKAKIGLGATVGYGAQYNKGKFTTGWQATAGLQFRF